MYSASVGLNLQWACCLCCITLGMLAVLSVFPSLCSLSAYESDPCRVWSGTVQFNLH